MPRNFDRRVEAVAPVEAPAMHERLRSLLQVYLDDNRQAWDLRADGVWTQRVPDGVVRASHDQLLRNSWGIGAIPVVRDSASGVSAGPALGSGEATSQAVPASGD
jgi:hypothetical protein